MPHASHHIAKSASLISVATLVSRLLGLVREQLIAYLFSRTATDAFYVAFRIPNLLRDLFAEGAMSSAFVPTFTEYIKKRTLKEAWQLASNVLTLLLIALSILCAVGIFFSNGIIGKFAGEYRAVPEKFGMTVAMTEIMFPFLPIIALSAVVMGILNSRGTFFLACFGSGTLQRRIDPCRSRALRLAQEPRDQSRLWHGHRDTGRGVAPIRRPDSSLVALRFSLYF